MILTNGEFFENRKQIKNGYIYSNGWTYKIVNGTIEYRIAGVVPLQCSHGYFYYPERIEENWDAG